ncbi:hypothetical protein GOBAR_AA03342 [Gossypium barbadense]|uniref:Uncharacterized protein n=1 Tax=Gossypium barbadense TaxID=3634 RepID=A0A2P5YNW9_GOSBA|nr:hypothetical protein GOBAR_AA03342 [Gossypium barbadense]
MLSKFISVSETRFQNTETTLKNQQASIQEIKTQLGQLSKLISEQPQGSLPSNTEPNPREQLNAINIQDEEGVVEPEPKPRQEPLEISLKEVHESLSNNSKGSIHEERRLQIEELDEWRTHKLRTHDKLKLRQDELDTSPNQLKVGDKVLLDAADPHIVTTTPNEEIPFMVLSIFPFGTVEVSHPKFGTIKMEKFKEENDLDALTRHIHFSPSKCRHTLAPSAASYNPSRSKASVLPPSLRYLHAILAQTITGRRESIGVVNTHDAYFLCMRMIERRRGTYLPQYCLAQSTMEEAYEDIPDEVPPQHEDPPTQPLLPSRPVHVATSYADISDRLTQFEQQCFQRFDNIDATLQQICQHLHISSPVPTCEPSSDEDV